MAKRAPRIGSQPAAKFPVPRHPRKATAPAKQQNAGASLSLPWKKLVRAHRKQAALAEETIYALPEGLIDALCIELPDLLTRDDEEFERDLAERSELGFFLGYPIDHPSITGDQRSEKTSAAHKKRVKRHGASAAKIRQMLAEMMAERGRTKKEIQSYFAKDEALKLKINERQLSYAGWLATCPGFRQDRDQFRRQWAARIEASGAFPRFPLSFFGEQPPTVPKKDRGFYSAYMQFYRRWGLDGMASWELPVPMRPELTTVSVYPLSHVGDAGVVLFVPWYVLRDKDITLREVAEHKQLLAIPEPMEPWVNGVPKGWGHDRYRLMLEVYIYLDLGLTRRYGERLKRSQEKLDLAFSRYLCGRKGNREKPDQMMDTVKKIRLKMNRRLNEYRPQDLAAC